MPVAPHKNREVALVLSGAKPLATIEKSKDPLGYAVAVSLVSAGTLYGRTSPTQDCPTGEITFTKVSSRHRMDEYDDLMARGIPTYGVKEYHRRMGRLFGYKESDIEDFISANIQCNCAKCAGSTHHE